MTRRIDAGLAGKAVALLRAQGLPAEAVLARAGLDMATLSRKGARIPFAGHVALLEQAAAAARDPCFGLPWAPHFIHGTWASSATLGRTRRPLATCSVLRGSICPCSPRGRGSRS